MALPPRSRALEAFITAGALITVYVETMRALIEGFAGWFAAAEGDLLRYFAR